MELPDPNCPWPHLGVGPWDCCRVVADNLPSNRFEALGEAEEPLPGWTVQTGNARAEPKIICPFCDDEYTVDEIHLHTRVSHGYELAISPDNRVPHPYSANEGRVVNGDL
jgi:hypothetical protein